MARTGPGQHRHLDSRGKWTTDRDEPHTHEYSGGADTPHPADALTQNQVTRLVALLDEVAPSPVPTPTPAPSPAPSGTVIPVGGFVSAIANAAAGQSFVVAPGTHSIPSGTIPRLVAPNVTLAAQSGTPLIKPDARPDGLYIQKSGTTVRGLGFGGNPGTYNDGSGSALLEVLGRDERIYDTVLEDLAFDSPVGAAKVQHNLYLNGDIERLTASGITSHGHGSSASGLHAYHAPRTPCRDIVIEDWVFTDHFDAILFWLACTNLTIRRCDFIGTRQLDIRLWLYGGTATISNCRGSKGIRVDGPTTVIESGNNWSWTP